MKAKFWEESNGDQSSARLIFIGGSIWNMVQTSAVVWFIIAGGAGVAAFAAAAGTWSAIQSVLSAYILINKNNDSKKKEIINET